MWPVHSASSFNFQDSIVSVTIFGSCLRLIPRISVKYILSYTFRSISYFRSQFLRKTWPIHSGSSFSFQYPLVSLTIFGSCLPLLPRLSVTYILSYILRSISCFRSQFLRKTWPLHSASSFNFQYPIVSLTIFGSCLRLLPRLYVTFILSYTFHSISYFRSQFLRKTWPIHSASSFNFQYPLFSLTIFDSCLPLPPRLSVTYISILISFVQYHVLEGSSYERCGQSIVFPLPFTVSSLFLKRCYDIYDQTMNFYPRALYNPPFTQRHNIQKLNGLR